MHGGGMKKARKAYGWNFKAEVLAVYEVDGPAAAARLYGVCRRTVQSWASAAGVCTSAETKRATEAALGSLKARRLRIRDKLAERAEEMLDRMTEAMTLYVGSGAQPMPVEIERPSASVCKDLATTAAILIDKLRLEIGEVTGHDRVDLNVTDEEREEAERILRERIVAEAERITSSAGG